MPITLAPHEHCRVIVGCEEAIQYSRDLLPPFYLVSWANIANIYPSTELDLVIEMASKKAHCRLYATLAEARDGYLAFCRRNHKAEAHACFSATTRRPLHCIMAFLPESRPTRPHHPLHLLVLSNEDEASDESGPEEDGDEYPLFDSDDDIAGPNPLVYYPSPNYSPLPPSSPPLGAFEMPSSDPPPSSPTAVESYLTDHLSSQTAVDVSEAPSPPGQTHPAPADMFHQHEPQLARVFDSVTSVSSTASITSAILAGVGPSDVDIFKTCNASGPFFLVRLQSSRSFIFQSRYNAESVVTQFRSQNLWGCFMKCPGLIDCPDKLLRGDYETIYFGVRGRRQYGVFVDRARAQGLFDEEASIWDNVSILICPEKDAALRWVRIPVDLGNGPLARIEVE